MTMYPSRKNRRRILTVILWLSAAGSTWALAQDTNPASSPKRPGCEIEAVDYKGWRAQQLSNRWVQLIIVPQNGGRVMQVTFGGHPYLFVNPKFAGKYLPPNPSEWFNYGGDK